MLTVARKDLLRAASLVQFVVERKPTHPILAMMGIGCKDDVVTVQHKGIDGHLSQVFDGRGDNFPEVLVPAHRLVKSLAHVPGEYLNIRKLDDGRVEIANADRSTILRFMTLPPADCPSALDGAKPTFSATLPMGVLQQLIAGVQFAVSTEETRYYLNGAAIGVEGQVLSVTATDGHRLIQRRVTMADGSITGSISGRVIIPRQAFAPIMAMSKVESDATISFYGKDEAKYPTMVEVRQAHTVLRHKLIDGTYPDINRVIPKGLTAFVEFDPKEFRSRCSATISAVDNGKGRAMTLAATRDRLGMRVLGRDTSILKAADGKLKADDDEATASIRARVDGTLPTAAVSFNARYLMDMVGAFGAGKVRFYTNGEGGPAFIESEAGAATGFGVLMPMRADALALDWRPEPLAA